MFWNRNQLLRSCRIHWRKVYLLVHTFFFSLFGSTSILNAVLFSPPIMLAFIDPVLAPPILVDSSQIMQPVRSIHHINQMVMFCVDSFNYFSIYLQSFCLELNLKTPIEVQSTTKCIICQLRPWYSSCRPTSTWNRRLEGGGHRNRGRRFWWWKRLTFLANTSREGLEALVNKLSTHVCFVFLQSLFLNSSIDV
jgi:hypothetical protein